jgi:hypothetical protein
MSLLVLLNFALLAAVGALVADRFASSPTPTQMLSTQESKPASGPQPQIDEVLPSNPMAKDRQRSAASAEVRAPLSRPTAPSDAPIAPVENSKTSIVTPQADSERRPVEVSESVLVRTQPMKATVSYQGRSLGTSPVTVELARDEKRVLTISYPGYVTRQVTVTGGKRAAIRVTLKPTGQGRVTLRYFPASATVKINGKVVSKPSTNRIDHRLDVGQHRLTISDQRGRSRVIPFEVERDKTRNLATISLEPQPERP